MGLKIKYKKESLRLKKLAADHVRHLNKEQRKSLDNTDCISTPRHLIGEIKDIIASIGWPTPAKVGKAAARDFQNFLMTVEGNPEFVLYCWDRLERKQNVSDEKIPSDFIELFRSKKLMLIGGPITTKSSPARESKNPLHRRRRIPGSSYIGQLIKRSQQLSTVDSK